MKHLILCSFLLTAFISSAQDSLKRLKAIRINDIGAQIQLFSSSQTYTHFDDFRAIVPQSVLLKNDLTSYTPQGNGTLFMNVNATPVLSLFAGFKFSNKEKTGYRKHIRLNTGLTLFNQQVIGSYNDTRTRFYDQLTSGVTGNTITLDSVTMKSFTAIYSSSQVRLDVCFLWSSNQDKRRIAVYTGLGVSGGMSFQSTTSINYGTYSQLKISSLDEQYPNYVQGTSTFTSEEFKTGKDYGVAVYIPLGADLVLGKKRRFWKNTHLYYEVKPCYNALRIPGVRDFGSIGILHGWGLRFTV
jgi:hypothetical protein